MTSPAARRANADVVLADSTHSSCYLLGPVLLDGRYVGSAAVAEDTTTAAWMVKVHFDNDDFVTKVAAPYVNQYIAIVVDGVVQSAPRLDPGITGRDITITGSLTRSSAERLADRIAPAGTVRVELPTTPTTRPPKPFTARCRTVGSRLGYDLSSSGGQITAATARAAFARAHEAVPARLAGADANEILAFCYFSTPPASIAPPRVCPDGRIAVDPALASSPAMFAVDANLNAIRLPSLGYLAPGLTSPSTPTSCDASASP